MSTGYAMWEMQQGANLMWTGGQALLTVPVTGPAGAGAGTAATGLGGGLLAHGGSVVIHNLDPARPIGWQVLSEGPGSTPPPADGPGKWVPETGGMPPRARKYQSQVTGAPEGYVYEVDGVKFDGFEDGVLIEAKGEGYSTFITNEGRRWQRWFTKGSDTVEQMKRQSRAAGSMPVHWHVAEREFADFLRGQAAKNNLNNVSVIWTPPTP
ncbi:MAG: hypothetical protein H6739_22265 [Alphaproteobacteria bacterium]|nr:hypothetical protein [Alphaproteobacteria bacterium]